MLISFNKQKTFEFLFIFLQFYEMTILIDKHFSRFLLFPLLIFQSRYHIPLNFTT